MQLPASSQQTLKGSPWKTLIYHSSSSTHTLTLLGTVGSCSIPEETLDMQSVLFRRGQSGQWDVKVTWDLLSVARRWDGVMAGIHDLWTQSSGGFIAQIFQNALFDLLSFTSTCIQYTHHSVTSRSCNCRICVTCRQCRYVSILMYTNKVDGSGWKEVVYWIHVLFLKVI